MRADAGSRVPECDLGASFPRSSPSWALRSAIMCLYDVFFIILPFPGSKIYLRLHRRRLEVGGGAWEVTEWTLPPLFVTPSGQQQERSWPWVMTSCFPAGQPRLAFAITTDTNFLVDPTGSGSLREMKGSKESLSDLMIDRLETQLVSVSSTWKCDRTRSVSPLRMMARLFLHLFLLLSLIST